MKIDRPEKAYVRSGIGTLPGIWTHPDDEAYLMAGRMIQATAAGNRVVVATATKGEVGLEDSVVSLPDRLARRRTAEMAASLKAIGDVEHHRLGHPDGQLHRVPADTGVGRVTGLLERIRPDEAEPPAVPSSELAYAVNSHGAQLERKFAALAAHTSQTTTAISRLGRETFSRWWAQEAFVDAADRLTELDAA